MRSRALVGASLLAGAALFFSGALSPLTRETSGAAAPRARSIQLPDDAAAAAELGLTYLRTARDTADPSALPDAQDALRRSLELEPDGNLRAFVGMASLSNARHDFSRSVRWSRRAIRTNPHNADAYGLLGDALFELGRVRAADAAYQEMVSRRPDVASYVRASYALGHRGDTNGALRALKLALQAAGPAGETAAWVRHQIGDVYAGMGETARAARQNRIGTEIAPGYVPPTVGVAEALIARGRLDEAIVILESAVAKLPTIEYMTKLGGLYEAVGRTDDARRQHAATAAKLADHRAAGVLPDADFIVFYADHGLRVDAALREAFAIYEDRPTPKVADALAWVLHAAGRDREAWGYAREAVAAPQTDATTLLHAGTIARSSGHDGAARRLLEKAERMGVSLTTS